MNSCSDPSVNRKSCYRTVTVATFALIAIMTVFPVGALGSTGDLTVIPTRILFEGRDRTAQVQVVNRGHAHGIYRIEMIQMRMDEHGNLMEIDTPNENERFADRLIRYSPRQVELGPGDSQTIRLLLRKPAGLEDGEYRSHLLFYALPEESVGMDIERSVADSEDDFTIAIQMIFRISIPVIVRHGSLPVEFTIQELSVNEEENNPVVHLLVERHGQRSVYGDLDIYYEPVAGGETFLVGHSKDFVLYTSTTKRHFSLPLTIPDDVEFANGQLHVIYSTSENDVQQTLAKETISLVPH